MPATLVAIDATTCQGHAQCLAAAPLLLELDTNGFASSSATGFSKVTKKSESGSADLASELTMPVPRSW
jgi:ferredoxin